MGLAKIGNLPQHQKANEAKKLNQGVSQVDISYSRGYIRNKNDQTAAESCTIEQKKTNRIRMMHIFNKNCQNAVYSSKILLWDSKNL